LPGEAFERCARGATAHLAENDEAGLALDHRADCRTVEGALDQISLPVAGDQTALDVLRPMDNPQCFRDHSRSGQRGTSASARWLRLPQGLDHQRLQPTPRLRVDRGIDRLVADALARIVGMHASKSGCDLLRRPAPMDQTGAHPVVDRSLRDQFLPPNGALPRHIMRKPCNLWIIPAGCGTPRQFKPDGGMMPPKKAADLTQARSPSMFRKDHATFLGVQVLVMSFHRNILCPLGCRCRTSNLSLSC